MIAFGRFAKSALLISDKMALAFVANLSIKVDEFRLVFLNLLEVCGWSEEQFDRYLLNQIDQNW